MKKLGLILFMFLYSCATKSVTDLGSNKYLSVANDSEGLIKTEDSIQNAKLIAYEKCGAKTVVIDNVATREDNNGLPETSLTFHCK